MKNNSYNDVCIKEKTYVDTLYYFLPRLCLKLQKITKVTRHKKQNRTVK